MDLLQRGAALFDKFDLVLDRAIRERTTREAQVTEAINSLKTIIPVTPNLLADTYQFSTLGNGVVNTELTAEEAHANSIFSAYLSDGGSVVNTKMTVLTLDQLKNHGLHPVAGDDFALANPYYDSASIPFYGGIFRVVLFDIEAVSGTNGAGYLHQGCYPTTAWGRGANTVVYSSALVNVLEASGGLTYSVHGNMGGETVLVGAADVGAGWQYKHGTQTGFIGCHQPWTRGSNVGRLKFAMCLPYIGFGDHGDNFVWADSIARPSQIKAGTHPNYRYSHFMGN